MLPSQLQEPHVNKKDKVLCLSAIQSYEAEPFIVDPELSAKLESELRVERDTRDSDTLPSALQNYLDSSPFKVSHFYSIIMRNLIGASSKINLAKRKLP